MKPKVKFLEVGRYVRWMSPEGYMMAGKILDAPGTNRQNQSVYPIELLNGTKTAVNADKLEVIPNSRKNMSASGKLALKKEIENINNMKKGNNPNQNGGIDQTALLKAREAEISDLKETISRNKQEYVELQAKFDELSKMREETPVKIDVIRTVTEELKQLVNDLLSDEQGETVGTKAVARGLLPTIYKLVTLC